MKPHFSRPRFADRTFAAHLVPYAILWITALVPRAQAAELDYRTSWIGNTFSGKTQWVLQDVAGIFVDGGGTLFTNVQWEEGGGNVEQYQDGKLIRYASHTHGWGYEGGDAVAANAQYVFIAQNVDNENGGLTGDSWPPKGLSWSGVSRRQRADIRKGAPFEGGHGKQGDVLQGAFLAVIESPHDKRAKERSPIIRGLWATSDRLFVSDPFDDSIKVYDARSMQPIASWKVPRPDRICMDRDGRLWVLQRPDAGRGWTACCLDADGKILASRIEFGDGVAPSAFCVDRQNRLLVADAGPDEQIKIYDGLPNAPHLATAMGVKGGVLAGPVRGAFGSLRFNHLTGIGADSAGNVYAASSGSVAGGSTVLERYSPGGNCTWRVMGLTFVDLADMDPGSDEEVYSKEEHFHLDYSKADGEEWSYRACTVDKTRYPDDPRLHLSPTHVWVRRIQGQKLLFVTDMTGEFLHVYRFNEATDGEIAIPCAMFSKRHVDRPDSYPPHQPERGEWMWIDRNGNGAIDAGEYVSNGNKEAGGIFEPDERGAIWNASGSEIRCLPLAGLDKNGVPSWDYASARAWKKPADLDEVRRLHYLPASDLMILGGNRGPDRNQHWKPMGPVLCAYDGWSTATPKLRWRKVLPYEKGASGHESAEPISFDVAGNYLFAAYTRGLPDEGIKYAFVKVYRLTDMTFCGNLVSERDLGEVGLLDLVESVHASRRSDGEYIVLLEDDAKAKVIMFRWKPESE